MRPCETKLIMIVEARDQKVPKKGRGGRGELELGGWDAQFHSSVVVGATALCPILAERHVYVCKIILAKKFVQICTKAPIVEPKRLLHNAMLCSTQLKFS